MDLAQARRQAPSTSPPSPSIRPMRPILALGAAANAIMPATWRATHRRSGSRAAPTAAVACRHVRRRRAHRLTWMSASPDALADDLARASRCRGTRSRPSFPVFTANVAKVLRLDRTKGHIAVGGDADLVVLDEAHGIREVMAGGRFVVRAGEACRPRNVRVEMSTLK